MATNTEYNLATFTFIWTIENYPKLDYNGKVMSPKFALDSMKRTSWYVEIIMSHYLNLFECALWRDEDRGPPIIEIEFELSILSADGTPLIEKMKKGAFKKGTGVRVTGFKEMGFFSRRTEFVPRNSLTLRCRIWRKDAKISSIDLHLARTRLGMECKSFMWILHDLSSLQPFEERPRTLRFTINGFEAFLRLCLFLAEKDNMEYLWLKITDTSATRKFHISWEISLVGVDGKAHACEKNYGDMGCPKSKELLVRVFSKSTLRSYTSHLFPFDAVCLKCEVEVGIGDIWNRIEFLKLDVSDSKMDDTAEDSHCHVAKETIKNVSSIDNDFQELTLSSQENNPSTQGSILRDMLATNKDEGGRASRTPDEKYKTFCHLIEYVEKDSLPPTDWKSVSDLLVQAEEFELGNLTDACFTFLRNNLSLSNICDVIKLAYSYSKKDFRRAVETYFLEHDTKILNSRVWKTFKQDNPRDALKILERVYMQKIQVFEFSV
ncbi:TD and POZ domain-containing protein 4 [Trichonephila clavata]|uniref:TD and POZ domain-containing protein 4 n=1 Tax=Trichonephila clavata TaxID=2740835 RepID=A0A8X6F6J7_TRICU|nr:TD and POZ domain-containing protein 4 [Trichonephila clavata]